MLRVVPSRFRPRARLAALLLLVALLSCWKVDADLYVSTNEINFGATKESGAVTVRNDSEDNSLTSGVTTLTYQLKPDRPWLKVSPSSGACGAMEKITHTVSVDRSLMAYGENAGAIAVTSNGGAETILVKAIRLVPGCSDPPTAPGAPSPASGATQVSVDVDLSWENGESQCDQLTATYDVYFGDTTPPPFHHDNDSLKVWDPGPLANNRIYYWRVVAKDANGATTGREWTFRTVCNLGPTEINLISPADGAVDVSVNEDLAWGGGNSQCPGLTRTYDVYFGTTSPPPFVNNTSIKYWDPGVLAKGTTYYWRIVARDANGSTTSAQRSFATAQAACTTKPSAVELVSPANNATNVPVTQDLVWSGGDSQCPGLTATYDVYFGTVTPPPFHHDNGNAKSWDAPLDYNTVYYWRVVAKDANGSTSSSERTFRTPCNLPPTTPTLIYPADGATGVAITDNLTWNNGNSQCAGLTATYDVYFGIVSPPPLVGNSGSTKAWDPGIMLSGTRYYWKVVAKDAMGSSSSVQRSFTTALLPCTTGPGTVFVQSPADGADDVSINVSLVWSGGASQCDGLTATYDVYFGTSSPPPFDHNNGSNQAWDPGTLQYSTTYYWRVVAKDANGETPGSVWSFTTKESCLSSPTAPCSPNPSDGKINVNENANLSWSCGDSQCGLPVTYDVYFGTMETLGEEHKLGSTTEKAWNLPRMASLTKYYWKIVVRDANGATSGPVWSFTTRANL